MRVEISTSAILEMHKNLLVDENGTILFEARPDPARLLDKYYTCWMSADACLAVRPWKAGIIIASWGKACPLIPLCFPGIA